ncbi:unnamed protein product [Allacma fusca]|uniref:Very-long-chain (3R)-3-hydroxyacyl-CoA dehydratase n=1 Tax=Allacma fusca TaxID=39272 RepID=A0A8J2L6T6_9HEXA|nr:unnamed protein product [Allacma fusca]
MAKTLSPVVKAYLLLYNIVLTLGWVYVGYLGFQKRNEHTKIWAHSEIPLKIFQTAAVMEVVHAILGFTPTSFVIVAFQVASRLLVVWGCLDLAPPARVSTGVPLLFVCWTVTEVIRYGYYALNLVGLSNIIVWFRYSFFVFLYPLGITGELWALLDSLDYVKKHNVWTIRMPNAWNATFNYHHMLILIMLLYIPIFPKLYCHMFAQRRKVLGGARPVSPVKRHTD